MLTGSSKYFLILPSHFADKAPSTTLWSAETMSYIESITLYGALGSVDDASNTTFFYVAPTPKIVDCGGLMTDVTLLMPNIPILSDKKYLN